MTLLRLVDICHSFPIFGKSGELKILEGIDLEIMPGENVALIGASGVGKTTLLYISAGLCHPNSGKVWFGERDFSAMTPADLSHLRRNQIGLALQNSLCLSSLSVRENLMLPMRLNGENTRISQYRAKSMLDRLNLNGLESEKISALSGGQRRRLGLGRALVMEPQLLLADEPTADLDEETGENVIRLICEKRKQCPRAGLIVTHDKRLMTGADRVVELSGGVLGSC